MSAFEPTITEADSRLADDIVSDYALGVGWDDAAVVAMRAQIAYRLATHREAAEQRGADTYSESMDAERSGWNAEIERLREQVNRVYAERNMLVGALSKLFPSWIRYDQSEPEWPVVIVALPTGQVSWHITKLERYAVFGHIYEGDIEWDGHDDVEKWRRVCLLAVTAPEVEP